MKLKKVLALAVCLAMVLSLVPAFSIAASAAEEQTVIFDGAMYAVKSENLFPEFSEWTAGVGTGSWGTGSNEIPKHDTVGALSEWKQEHDDALGDYVTEVRGSDNSSNCGWNMSVSPLIFVKIDPTKTYFFSMKYRNDNDATMFVRYGAINENSYTSNGNTDGVINFSGTGYRNNTISHTAGASLPSTHNYWRDEASVIVPGEDADYFIFNDAWVDSQVHSFAQMELYEVEKVADAVNVTVKYMDGAEEVYSEDVTPHLVGTDGTFKPAVNKYFLSEEKGFVYSVGEAEEIVVGKENNVSVVPLTKARKLAGEKTNMVADGGFDEGSVWPGLDSQYFAVEDGVLKSVNNDSWATSHDDHGIGGIRSFQTTVNVTPGKMYYYSIDVYTNGSAGLWMNYSFNKTDAPIKYAAYDYAAQVDASEGTQTNCTAGGSAQGMQISQPYAYQWHSFDGLVSASEVDKMFEFDVYYMHDCARSMIDNVRFYEVELLDTQITGSVKQVLGDEVLAEKTGVIGEAEVSLPEATFYKDGVIYTVDAVTATLEKPEVTVEAVADETKTPASFDAFFSFNDARTLYEPWGTTSANNNVVQITGMATASSKPGEADLNKLSALVANDADGASTVGESVDAGQTRPGMFKFAVPKDYEVGKLVTLNLFVQQNHKQTHGSRLAIVPSPIDASEFTKDGGDVAKSAADLTPAPDAPVSFSAEIESAVDKNAAGDYTNESGWITVDVTEAVKDAKTNGKNDITLLAIMPSGLIKVAQLEDTGFGASQQGNTAYLSVSDGVKVDVAAFETSKITKNGSIVTAPVIASPGDVIRAYADFGSAAVTDGKNNYYPVANGAAVIEVAEEDITVADTAELNIAMLDGAQVRTGSAYNEKDGTVDLTDANSGLRFIAVVKGDGITNSAEEFGVAIKADKSETEVLIPAEKFQNDEKTVFTAVLTNLKKGNYNRKFTARPYAVLGGETIYGTSTVERSVYEVSARMLLQGVQPIEGADFEYELDKKLTAVLNAYVNNVGIRLNMAEDKFTPSDKYTGDVLFTVDSAAVTNETGTVYTITVTPVASSAYVIDKELFLDNVRINNINSAVAEKIDESSINIDENGILTFTYTVPAAVEG